MILGPLPDLHYTAVQGDRRFEQAWAQYWRQLDNQVRRGGVFLNFQAFGGVGDGTTDNTAAWQAATAALATTGGKIYFPAGKYFFANAISFTYPTQSTAINGLYDLSLVGDGPDASILYFNTASSGMTITPVNTFTGGVNNQSFHADDLSWTTGQAGGSTGLTLTQSNHNTGDFAAQSVLTNCTFRGDNGYSAQNASLSGPCYWTTCVNVHGISNVNLINCIMEGGNNGGAFVGTCLAYGGIANTTDVAVVMNVYGCTFMICGIGFAALDFIQGLTFTACNFEACVTAFNCGNGLSQSNAQAMFNNCQFGPSGNANCIIVESAFNNVAINNCIFVFTSSSQGGILLGQVSNSSIMNCIFVGGGAAIVLSALTVACSVVINGNTFGTMTAGVSFANQTINAHNYTATTVASSNINVTNNTFIAVTSPIDWTGTFVANSGFSINDNTFLGIAGTSINLNNTINASAGGSITDNTFVNGGTAINLHGSTQNISLGPQVYVGMTTPVTNAVASNVMKVQNKLAGNYIFGLYNNNGSSGDHGLVVVAGQNGTTDVTTNMIGFLTAGGLAACGAIQRNDSAGVNHVQYLTASDGRLKPDAKLTRRGLDDLMKVQVVEWGGTQGYVAQQVADVYPEAASAGGDDPVTQPAMVDYGRMSPLILRAVQELKEQHDKEISDLRSEIASLKRLN